MIGALFVKRLCPKTVFDSSIARLPAGSLSHQWFKPCPQSIVIFVSQPQNVGNEKRYWKRKEMTEKITFRARSLKPGNIYVTDIIFNKKVTKIFPKTAVSRARSACSGPHLWNIHQYQTTHNKPNRSISILSDDIFSLVYRWDKLI